MGELGSGENLSQRPIDIGKNLKESSQSRSISSPLPISLLEFMSSFSGIETRSVFKLPAFPQKDEAARLATLEQEVMLIKGKDGNTYVIKSGEEIKETEHSFEMFREQFEQLNPEFTAHTHPTDNSEDPQRRLLGTVIPSAADLTGRKYGIANEYIFSEFGRTTLTPIENLGNLPQGHQQEGADTIMQQIVNNTMQAGFKEARKQGITEVEQAINFVGNYIKIIGCKYKFERWDEVKDIEKPPDNFI